MTDPTRLIEHLLNTQFSIDRVDSIVKQLNISRNQLLQLINDEQYREYFQILRPSNDQKQGVEKIALTLDLFYCTHYANNCRNNSCPFIHICPYNVRPTHVKCSNKTCPYDHDVYKSQHNRMIIDAHGLSYLPAQVLHKIIRASADPSRSFWVCQDFAKKDGCAKQTHCDRLHYCYYMLTDTCTKSQCQHVINDACLAYFRRKDIDQQDDEDILDAFRKVLRQRKTDYVKKSNVTTDRSASASASPIISNSGNHQRKSPSNRRRRRHPSSPSRITNISSADSTFTLKSEPPSPSPVHDQDILLVDYHDDRDYQQIEQNLSSNIGCPIRLLLSKEIHSKYKDDQSSHPSLNTLYYYYPIKNPQEIFDLLRWQNTDNQILQPIIVYASIRDAHDAARQFPENNQFCLLRVYLFHSGAIKGDLLSRNRLQLSYSSTMRFDRMWIYIYNF